MVRNLCCRLEETVVPTAYHSQNILLHIIPLHKRSLSETEITYVLKYNLPAIFSHYGAKGPWVIFHFFPEICFSLQKCKSLAHKMNVYYANQIFNFRINSET